MSWLRDPDTGDVAKPLNANEIQKLEAHAGRHKQPRGMHWVVVRDENGKVVSFELKRIPKGEKGLSL